MSTNDLFSPTWASPPGETIREVLFQRGLTTKQFETEFGVSGDYVQKLFQGEIRITPDLAARLSSIIGSSSEFWLSRDSQYIADLQRLEQEGTHWLVSLPVADMLKYQWISAPTDQQARVRACLSYFNVTSVEEWREKWLATSNAIASFRTSPTFTSDSYAVATWLRQGEIQAAGTSMENWSADAFFTALSDIRKLTRNRDPEVFLPRLQRICAECGVAVTVVRAPKGCKASGATKFLTPQRALLQLSFRYLSDDQFWFTFFHEAGHLLLHGDQPFIDLDGLPASSKEQEANEFAARTLVPSQYEVELVRLGANAKRIIRFARDIDVAPGIVVGQLQHRGLIARNRLNSLKRRYTWRDA